MSDRSKKARALKMNISFKEPPRKLPWSPNRLLQRILLVDHLERLYQEVQDTGDGTTIMSRVLERLNVSYDVSEKDLARIPTEGTIVAVSNHPYGGIEAIIMCAILASVRSDVKMLANYLLRAIPEAKDYCIFVDPFSKPGSHKSNVGPLKETAKWLRNGHVLGVFPSGEVSHLSLKGRGVIDPLWNKNIGRIIRMVEAPVVPIFIAGHNGPMFQMAGLIHPRLRTAMLPHEFLNKRDRCIKVAVGSAIPFEKLAAYSSDSDIMDYLRFRTYMLANRINMQSKRHERREEKPRRRARREEPIGPPSDPELMAAEISRLPPESLIVENGELQVLLARAQQIRHVLHEIGRLRELAFREEREGTGKSIDLDRFDEHYEHLFLWNNETKEIIGAYRWARTDVVLREFGKRGLYTSTLFRYKRKLLKKLGPSLELGRSFVRPEYQKNYSSLLLLLKGIFGFVARNPKYHKLFGPVSISNDYRSASRWLLAAFFKVNENEKELAHLIKAKRPLKSRPAKGCAPRMFENAVKDVETVSNVISDIESDHKGVPILLKQYLRLGGKLLGFNVDPEFGNVLDGLIMVDFVQTDKKQLVRLMGKDAVPGFMAYHNRTPEGLPIEDASVETTATVRNES